jgi:hypothetical protein
MQMLKNKLSDVYAALEKQAGKSALVLIEQRLSFGKEPERIQGLLVSSKFQGKNQTERWALVGGWLDDEDIDQKIVGLLELLTPAEHRKRMK